MDYLLFRLYGPLASWGEVAVGQVRPSELHPTRSSLLGILAAALGLRRSDDAAQTELSRMVRFAVLCESLGVPSSDFQTAQVAPPRRGRRFVTRSDQLRGPSHGLRTVPSSREYRCDGLYLVAVWSEAEQPRWSLYDLESALKRPAFNLYLGRKACPAALPLAPELVTAGTLEEALRRAPKLPEGLGFDRIHHDGPLDLYWEGAPALGGLEEDRSVRRRDDPVSRRRWTFQGREEHHASFRAEPFEEELDVSQPD